MSRISIVYFSLFLFVSSFLYGNDCNYKLKLSMINIKNDIHVGDYLNLILELSGDDFVDLSKTIIFDLNGIYRGSNIFQTETIEESLFEQKLIIEAKESGLFQIGPYKLNLGNCLIESNSLEIIVQERREPIKIKKVISFVNDKITIKLGDTARVMMKANFRDVKLPKDDNKNMIFQRGSLMESMSIEKNKSIISVNMEVKIFPLRKGTFIINSDYFENLEDSIEVKDLIVEVE